MPTPFVNVALKALHPCACLSVFHCLLNLVLERQAGRLQMPVIIQARGNYWNCKERTSREDRLSSGYYTKTPWGQFGLKFVFYCRLPQILNYQLDVLIFLPILQSGTNNANSFLIENITVTHTGNKLENLYVSWIGDSLSNISVLIKMGYFWYLTHAYRGN